MLFAIRSLSIVANSRAILFHAFSSHGKLYKEVNRMPAIKPVSDLRNYNEVLKEVDRKGIIYLARKGQVLTQSCPSGKPMNTNG